MTHRILPVLLAMLISGCSSIETVVEVIDHGGLTGEQFADAKSRVWTWRSFGFGIDPDSAPDLIVTIEGKPLDGYGGLANREKNRIILNTDLDDRCFKGAAAHELGHILLDTSRHLDSGDHGVMASPLECTTRLSDGDFELAEAALSDA